MSIQPEVPISFPSGAQRSAHAVRYDLVPREAIEALARRLTLGAAKYGEHNWQKGTGDADFKRDTANHLLAHLLDYLESGNDTDMNTDGIIANAAFLCYFEAKRTPVKITRRK